MAEAEIIENAAALTEIFGEWPSFHDAEVLAMHLDRAGEDGPRLTACVHVFRMTDRVDARGFYVLTDHTRVRLRFANVLLRQLRWFNEQNSLSDLLIYEVDPAANEERRLSVSFGSNWGVEAHLLCDRVVVESVDRYDPSSGYDEGGCSGPEPLVRRAALRTALGIFGFGLLCLAFGGAVFWAGEWLAGPGEPHMMFLAVAFAFAIFAGMATLGSVLVLLQALFRPTGASSAADALDLPGP